MSARYHSGTEGWTRAPCVSSLRSAHRTACAGRPQRRMSDSEMNARSPVKEPPEPKLIAAARKAVENHGYSGLTLERIAGEADVSRVTLHRRGHSKDEIFNALIVQVREEHRDALWPAPTASGDGAGRLRLAVAKVCDMCERDLLVMLALRAHLDAVAHGAVGPDLQTNWIVAAPRQILARD